LVGILKLIQIWHAMHRMVGHSNVSIHEENNAFNMNVPLSYKMFKWRGVLDIQRDNPLWYPNHVLTPMWCKSIIKITKDWISSIKLNWIHLSLNFGEVVPISTIEGWVCLLIIWTQIGQQIGWKWKKQGGGIIATSSSGSTQVVVVNERKGQTSDNSPSKVNGCKTKSRKAMNTCRIMKSWS
jgi:hypothetical protein